MIQPQGWISQQEQKIQHFSSYINWSTCNHLSGPDWATSVYSVFFIIITAFLSLGCHFTSFALVIIPPTNQVSSAVSTCTGAIKLGTMFRYIKLNNIWYLESCKTWNITSILCKYSKVVIFGRRGCYQRTPTTNNYGTRSPNHKLQSCNSIR